MLCCGKKTQDNRDHSEGVAPTSSKTSEVCSCGNRLLPDALFCPECGRQKAGKTIGDRETELKVIEELGQMATKLQANMQKYPKGGRKLLSLGRGTQLRYFAVVPGPLTDSATEFQRWKGGILGYWESNAAFEQKEAPKGFVNLLWIVKVDHLPREHDSKGVRVKHKEGDKKQELVIIANSENQAKEWSFLMYEFLATLRSHDG